LNLSSQKKNTKKREKRIEGKKLKKEDFTMCFSSR